MVLSENPAIFISSATGNTPPLRKVNKMIINDGNALEVMQQVRKYLVERKGFSGYVAADIVIRSYLNMLDKDDNQNLMDIFEKQK